jgi:hypothetical protein
MDPGRQKMNTSIFTQTGDAVISETIYPYPDPLPLLRDIPAQSRHSNACSETQEGTSGSGNPLQNRPHTQVYYADDIKPEHTLVVQQ